jgi:hypothetical protein
MRSHALKGLLHAVGVAVYVAVIVVIMQNVGRWFPSDNDHRLIGPMVFLLLFVISAAITGTLVLGRPLLAYLDGRKSEAVALFLATVSWLVIILAVTIGVLAVTR